MKVDSVRRMRSLIDKLIGNLSLKVSTVHSVIIKNGERHTRKIFSIATCSSPD